MNLYVINHGFHYELENVARLFFPNEKITVVRECERKEEPYIYTETVSYTHLTLPTILRV